MKKYTRVYPHNLKLLGYVVILGTPSAQGGCVNQGMAWCVKFNKLYQVVLRISSEKE